MLTQQSEELCVDEWKTSDNDKNSRFLSRSRYSAVRYHMQWQSGPHGGDRTPPDLNMLQSKPLPGLARLHTSPGKGFDHSKNEDLRGPVAPARPRLPVDLISNGGVGPVTTALP